MVDGFGWVGAGRRGFELGWVKAKQYSSGAELDLCIWWDSRPMFSIHTFFNSYIDAGIMLRVYICCVCVQHCPRLF